MPIDARYWLSEDVAYIISPEERCAFLHLSTNEERDQFIEQFCYRRSVDPASPDDNFRVEHYRRIAVANETYKEQFPEGGELPGWKSNRGRIYVLFGAPDSVKAHRRKGSGDPLQVTATKSWSPTPTEKDGDRGGLAKGKENHDREKSKTQSVP